MIRCLKVYVWASALLTLLIVGLFSRAAFAQETRIKDLANFRGFRTNQLIGFGLVVGLNNTGDSPASLATNQAVGNMLTRIGVKTGPDGTATPSVAAVIATADLPAFSRVGDKIDVKISTIGDAKSLAGGTLLLTPLRAGDGQVYIIAQGAVSTGQANGSGTQVLTVARVPSGGVVEREFAPALAPGGKITLSLKNPDFTTNHRLAERINIHFKGFFAKAIDPVTTEVEVPPLFMDRKIEFIAELEALKVSADQKSVVVLNERTGTVVMGAEVVLSSVAIAHGALSIQVGKDSKKDDKAGGGAVAQVGGNTVGELVESLNAFGVKPADLVGILQALHTSGALKADLQFL